MHDINIISCYSEYRIKFHIEIDCIPSRKIKTIFFFKEYLNKI